MTSSRRMMLKAASVIAVGGALLMRPQRAEARVSCGEPFCTDSCAFGLGEISCVGCEGSEPQCEWALNCWTQYGEIGGDFLTYCGAIS